MQRVTSFFVLEPEVPGGLGERSVVEPSETGPRVLELHYEFHVGCRGDDLATSHPVFIISERVGSLARGAGLTGFELAGMDQSLEEQVLEWKPDLRLPAYRWLQVNGKAGHDDLGIDGTSLVVSERALAMLEQHAQLSDCEIAPWPGAP